MTSTGCVLHVTTISCIIIFMSETNGRVGSLFLQKQINSHTNLWENVLLSNESKDGHFSQSLKRYTLWTEVFGHLLNLGVSNMVWVRPPVMSNLNTSVCKYILNIFVLSSLWRYFREGSFTGKCLNPCTKIKDCKDKKFVVEFDVEEINWFVKSIDLNSTSHLWDELEQRL